MDLEWTTDESKRVYTVTTDMAAYNEEGLLRPESYAKLMAQVVEQHLEDVTGSVPWMIEQFNVSWALLSNHFYVKRHPKQNETLTVHTWCSDIKSMFFMRDIIFLDKDGEEVFGAASTSVLIDLAERAMLKSGPVYDRMIYEKGPKLYPDKVKLKTKGYDFESIGEVVVEPSWLDPLGHMNNLRYYEVLYNYISEEARAKYGKATDFEMHFQQEMGVGESILLERCETEEEAVLCGYKKEQDGTAGHLSFAARIRFGDWYRG